MSCFFKNKISVLEQQIKHGHLLLVTSVTHNAFHERANDNNHY